MTNPMARKAILWVLTLAVVALAAFACRMADVVSGPPTFTPAPVPTATPAVVPTAATGVKVEVKEPRPDFNATREWLGLPTRAPARISTPKPGSFEDDCDQMVELVNHLRRTGSSDQEVVDAFMSSGMVSAEGSRVLMELCGVEIGEVDDSEPPRVRYVTPTTQECRELKASVKRSKELGISDQQDYDRMVNNSVYTEEGIDNLLRQAGACGIRLDATPIPRHADFEVFQ